MSYKNEKLEEFNNYLKNRKVAVIGLGVSNIPLIEYLHNLNSKVTIFDKRNMEEIDKNIIEKITEYSMEFSFGKEYLSRLIGFDIIFRSPSCLPTTLQLVSEQKRGAIVTSEIEMLLELCPGTVVGVTGSDGKTTTTSLIYEILKEAGYNCYLGGNIGTPLFTKIEEMMPEDKVVLELSSFQLMGMKISPKISVITNITPNHLDIHKSYDEYIEAKKNIFKYQDKDGLLVINYDNDITREFIKEAKGNVIYFSSKTKLEDGFILDGNIIKESKNKVRKHILNTNDVILRGRHNYENICTALAATSTLVDTETAVKAICKFKGVEHRLEFVREINGAKWYNDSIGSSPTRTIAGLNSFDENIILIAGGYDKHLDYTPMAKPVVDKVGVLVLVGQTSEKIYNAVKKELNGKYLEIHMCKTLEEAVNAAYKVAKRNDVVLFSPASASFDMFKNFDERGKKFKEIVNNL